MSWQVKAPMMVSKRLFKCTKQNCRIRNFKTMDYTLWLNHVGGRVHADTDKQGHGHIPLLEDIKQWLLIRGLRRSTQNSNILDVFCKWGIVLDFTRIDSSQALIKFQSSESVVDLVTSEKSAQHQVDQIKVRVYRMSRSGENPATISLYSVYREKESSVSTPLPERPVISYVNETSTSTRLEGHPEARNTTNTGVLRTSVLTAEPRESYNYPNNTNSFATSSNAITSTSSSPLSLSKQVHSNQSQHFFRKQWTQNLATNMNLLKLEDQLELFVSQLSLTNQVLLDRISIMDGLYNFLKHIYPRCNSINLFPCGMDYLGIGVDEDPLDFYLDLDGWMYAPAYNQNAISVNEHWKGLFSSLKNKIHENKFCKNVHDVIQYSEASEGSAQEYGTISFTVLHPPEVPRGSSSTSRTIREYRPPCVVRIRKHDFSNAQCIRLAKFYSSLDSRVNPLLLIVRYWIFYHGHFACFPDNVRNLLGILLVLFFLVNKKMLPPLFELQDKSKEKIYCDGNIKISFCSDSQLVYQSSSTAAMLDDKMIWAHSTLSLLKEFFKDLSSKDFTTNALCVLTGQYVKKKYFKSGAEAYLPKELREIYKYQAISQEQNDRREFYNSPFCIQHPFKVTRNVAAGLPALDLDRFQSMCSASANQLEQLPILDKPNFMDLFLDTDILEISQSEKEFKEMKIRPRLGQISPPSLEDWEKWCRLRKSPATCSTPPPPPSQKVEKPIISFRIQPTKNQPIARNSRNYSQRPESSQSSTPLSIHERHKVSASTTTSHRQSESYSDLERQFVPRGEFYSVPNSYSDILVPQMGEFFEAFEIDEELRSPYTILPGPLRIFSTSMSKSTTDYFIDGLKAWNTPFELTGKMLSLYMAFSKTFNFFFFSKCCGFSLKYHENSVQFLNNPEFSENVLGGQGYKKKTLEQRLARVPIIKHTQMINIIFQGQISNYILKPLTFGQIIMPTSNSIQHWGKMMDDVLRGISSPEIVLDQNTLHRLKFTAELVIHLDVYKFNSQPSTTLMFMEDENDSRETKEELDFVGRLYCYLAPRFIDRSFKAWLAFCSDHNLPPMAIEYSRQLRQKQISMLFNNVPLMNINARTGAPPTSRNHSKGRKGRKGKNKGLVRSRKGIGYRVQERRVLAGISRHPIKFTFNNFKQTLSSCKVRKVKPCEKKPPFK